MQEWSNKLPRGLVTKSLALKIKVQGIILISLLWMLTNGMALYQSGIVTAFEADKYIANADYLLQTGYLINGQFTFYFTQIAFIALAKHTGTFPLINIFIQLLANAYASWLFYQILYNLHKNRLIATIGTGALIGMYYYQQYNFYLFTESIYFSGSIIYFHWLLKIREGSWQKAIPAILLGIILVFTRPVGIFLLFSGGTYLLLRFLSLKSVAVILIITTTFLTLLLTLLNTAMNSGGEFDFLLPYSTEQIICGIPTKKPPHNLNISGNANSISGLWQIISKYPELFFTLAGKRLIAFWGVIRNYYSLAHNLFIGFYFFSLYLLILVGLPKLRLSDKPVLGFVSVLLLLTSLTAAVSCDEWHNRFIMALIPFLIIMGSFAGRYIQTKKVK